MHLCAFHKKAAVDSFTDPFGINRGKERRPACAAFKLCVLFKQRCPAANTHVGSCVFREIFVRTSTFRAMFTCDLECEVRKLIAPFRVRFDDLVHGFVMSFMVRVINVGRKSVGSKDGIT